MGTRTGTGGLGAGTQEGTVSFFWGCAAVPVLVAALCARTAAVTHFPRSSSLVHFPLPSPPLQPPLTPPTPSPHLSPPTSTSDKKDKSLRWRIMAQWPASKITTRPTTTTTLSHLERESPPAQWPSVQGSGGAGGAPPAAVQARWTSKESEVMVDAPPLPGPRAACSLSGRGMRVEQKPDVCNVHLPLPARG